MPGYARFVSLAEIANAANDLNLNIRRYVDNSPPPEPHDVRAHLLGGVPVGEVMDKVSLFDALGLIPPTPSSHARPTQNTYDFAPALPDRAAIRPLVDSDAGVQARLVAVRQGPCRMVDRTLAPPRRSTAAPRPESRSHRIPRHLRHRAPCVTMSEGITASRPLQARGRHCCLVDRYAPDFKTLLENGFPGVVDGWVDAIADAAEDDEAAGPAFDPFGHKLVRRTMTDYLERIATAKADIARLKGEKEAFEQSNAPDASDEEDLADWNYAKDLDRQIRDISVEHKAALKELSKLERLAGKSRATADEKSSAAEAKTALRPVFSELTALQEELAPYETIKTQLTSARALYRTLSNEFVNELKSRCGAMNEDQKRALVLELFAQDAQVGLDAVLAEKRQELVQLVEALWDKYRVTLTDLRAGRHDAEVRLSAFLQAMRYV